jgi:Stealth protein CR2, conserved region 2/Stealth protein CR3, conserved region 3/Stealth protein CR4, conserved region 4/Stealth protein CR1, conserved region 1/LNR domain
MSLCDAPIDVVYTWVNGSDSRLQEQLSAYKEQACRRAAQVANVDENESRDDDDVDQDGCEPDMASASRFVDNQELRYSLRSIEKFAPWVRRIFLVTNGQVPNWLRIDHPRLSVVTHDEIFVNKSHLPTFSSPAIESHLHRIEGLAERFVYLNDDVMFGAPVHPDDFITHSDGQKVFLSWAVPNCNEGCPANWIGDGYCDVACNVSSCDYDAGDCANVTSASGGGGGGGPGGGTDSRWWNNYDSASQDGGSGSNAWADRQAQYCAKGCPDTWIGDKYCDRACQNAECGFDAVDCGVEQLFGELFGIDLATNESTALSFIVPNGTVAMYVNLTSTVGDNRIVDGSHDNADLVRTATISQRHKIMTLTFHRNIAYQTIAISVTYELEDGVPIQIPFNITLHAKQEQAGEDQVEEQVVEDESIVDEQAEERQDEEEQREEQNMNSIVEDDSSMSRKLLWQVESERSKEYGEFIERRPKWMRRGDGGRRRLLDVFGDSLKFVDKLYNRAYGMSARKVPAHMPHFIQRDVMYELQAKWPDEYDQTSSHRLRSGDDMQMAFAYFYHLVHQPRNFDLASVFADVLDADRDGALNANELRTLAVYIKGAPLEHQIYVDLVRALAPSSVSVDDARVSLAELRAHADIVEQLRLEWAKVPKYRTSIRDTDDVAFLMVGTNNTNVKKSLDGIRSRRQRFICLNDNMNHTDPASVDVVRTLREFYESIVPLPSTFELPDNQLHEAAYRDDILAQQRATFVRRLAMLATFVAAAAVIVFVVRRSRGESPREWHARRIRRDHRRLQNI